MLPKRLVGKSVVSGIGETLGRVVAVERDPTGLVRRLLFREDGGALRIVKPDHVRTVGDAIELKGPREGFHMTRIGALRSPPDSPGDGLPPPGGTGS